MERSPDGFGIDGVLGSVGSGTRAGSGVAVGSGDGAGSAAGVGSGEGESGSVMVAGVDGVGWMVLDASKFLQSDVIFVGIILMGITGALLDAGIRWLDRALVPWRGKA